MNMSKKQFILIFISILAVLSTLFAYNTLATDPVGGTNINLPDEYFVEHEIGAEVQASYGYSHFSSEEYFTLSQLATTIDLLCSQRDNIEGIFDIEDLPGLDGTVDGTKFKEQNDTLDRLFPEGTAYLEDAEIGYTVEVTREDYLNIGRGLFTGKTLVHYKATGGGSCTPKEAYILSEMGSLSPHVGIHYELETDENGDPIKVDPYDGYFNFNDRFLLGEDEFFFGVKKYVTSTGSGDALSLTPGAGGTYEWIKIKRNFHEHSGDVEYVSKTGIAYAWYDDDSNVLFDSGVEPLPGYTGEGIVPGNVVVHIEGDGYYKADLITGFSNIQIAWWTTPAGGGGGSTGGNALAEEAQAFEDYILDVSGVSSVDQLRRKTATWIDEDGTEYTDDNAFDFEYNPSWRTDGEYADDKLTVRVETDTNTVVIGPFAIDYYEAHAHVSGRPYVKFAGITNMELYTDASTEPLEFGDNKDWTFVWEEGEREEAKESKYPKPNEKFYVRMKIIEGATKITDFKVYFKYMNAAGAYKTYEGTYQIQTWERGYVDIYEYHRYPKIDEETGEYVRDENGEIVYEYKYEWDHREYVFKLIDKKEYLEGQKLAEGEYGARWYEFCDITRSININEGKIIITKDLVDREGNVINDTDPDTWFHFTVDVEGAINSGETEWLEVQAGNSVESNVYYWLEGTPAPTYRVEETDTDIYDFVEVIKESTGEVSTSKVVTGTLDENVNENANDYHVTIRYKNTHERTGRLSIRKLISNKDEISDLVGQTFGFRATITGNFYYNGQKYTVDGAPLVLEPTVVAEGDPWVSEEFAWYGEDAPTYLVEEIALAPNSKLVTIRNASGRIVEGTTPVEAIAENEHIRESAKLKIIKTLEISDEDRALISDEQISNWVFYFNVTVDGYETIPVAIEARREGNTYIWEKEIGDFTWYAGHNPNYTIVEDEERNPEGTVFVRGIGPDGTVFTSNYITGTLTNCEEDTATIDNQVINKVVFNYGRIDVIKRIEDDDTLRGQSYKFALVVRGTFKYKGEIFVDQRVQISNDGKVVIGDEYDENNLLILTVPQTGSEVSWTSDEFKWFGDINPYYTIEEHLNGSDIKFSINPSEGRITANPGPDTPDHTTIIAYNRNKARAGELVIIKKVENSEFLTVDYIKSLSFSFKVEVDGFDTTILTTKDAQLENGEWVWRTPVAKYSWNEDNGTPHYKVTEIDSQGLTVVDGEDEGYLIENHLSDIEFQTTESSMLNKVEEKEGSLVIVKRVTDSSLVGQIFTFNVTLKGSFYYEGNGYTELTIPVTVVGGSSTTITGIKWYGDSAPTYSVTENESEIAELINVINGSGVISEEGTPVATAIFENESKETGGYLQVTKHLTDGISSDDYFEFEIRIATGTQSLEEVTPKIVRIKANQTWRSEYYSWPVTEAAPRYSVKEINIPAGAQLIGVVTSNGTVNNNVATGDLLPDSAVVSVVFTNEYGQEEGRFKVTKQLIADSKIINTLETTFTFRATISGTFILNGEEYRDGFAEIEFTIHVDPSQGAGTYESPVITYWKGNVPTVKVEETSLPLGWYNVGISHNESPITSVNGEELEIVVTNEFDIVRKIDITLELAGRVWEDAPLNPEDKNTENSVENGLIDPSESGVAGVEVYIYDANGNEAQIYKDMSNTPLAQPIITDKDGYWDAPRIQLTPEIEKYNVVFVYDGQTYEPTKFLATSNGDAEAYKRASTAGRDAYANDSMAIDLNRAEVNSRIATVSGQTPIDGNGETVGKATSTEGTNNNLYYKAESTDVFALNVSEGGHERVISRLQTTNSNGTAMDLFKTRAGTAAAGLEYPFDKKVHLTDTDTTITELGLEETYYYSATYNYCLNINLGLVKREEVDIGATKDLYDAKVVVNDKLSTYIFNKLSDLGQDCYSRQVQLDNQNIEYKLGLYGTDYYYRAEMYQTSKLYDKIEAFYNDINALKGTELEVYLTYNIVLYNNSGAYKVRIGTVNDYFDSTFGTPISTDVYKTIDGSSVKVAEKSTINGNEISWTVTERGIKGSDGITYNKMTTDLGNIELGSGETATILVTFKVNKSGFNGVLHSVKLGDKGNIAEIASYSSYYQDGTIAGKVDRDSAPDNVNIRNYNNKDQYEDDTAASPLLKLILNEETRSVEGMAWEDRDGEGNYDEDEALIGGLTVELVEKVEVDGVEYDFLWPTNKQLSCLGGRTLEELTGFDSTTETSKVYENIGKYSFTGIPAGKYVVRFLYGNDKTQLNDTFGITGDAVALNSDGTNYSGTPEVLTANYDRDAIGTTPAVYNGHDYKSAVYQNGFQVTNSNGFLTNRYHDLSNVDLANARVSDARDSESRRLELIAETETIMNTLGEILGSANDIGASHQDLYRMFYMYADTAILDLSQVESTEGVNRVVRTTDELTGGVIFEVVTEDYQVGNIDFALVERPETDVVLDKEISSIKLTTNTGREILNAKYDINYEIVSSEPSNGTIIGKVKDGYIVANVTLREDSLGIDVLQALNKNEKDGIQNFRFINVEDTILQGATIEINYLFTVLNVGETDYTSSTLANIETSVADGKTIKSTIKDLAKIKAQMNSTGDIQLGSYLGASYYTGDTSKDSVVTTRVRQLVDYVDNDAVFTLSKNASENHSWRNTTVTELQGSGYKENVLVGRDVIPEYDIVDTDGVQYITETRNNVILSADNNGNYIENENAGFEAKLVPYDVDSENYKSQIELTITKTVAAQDDADDMTYDNIAEIVKIENSVGRRDVTTIPGNANPKKGEFAASIEERDASATELVTFTPPTGIDVKSAITSQLMLVILVGLVIVAVGIVIIKKTVIK